MDYHYNSSFIGQARAPLLQDTDLSFNPFQNPSGASGSIHTSFAEGTEHLSIPNSHIQGRASGSDKSKDIFHPYSLCANGNQLNTCLYLRLQITQL